MNPVGSIKYLAPIFRVRCSRILLGMKCITSKRSYCIRISKNFYPKNRNGSKFTVSKFKYYSNQSKTCWKCTNSVAQEDLFCSYCNAVQKLDPNRSFFDLFGLREKYHVDLKVLHNRFRDLQRLLHPDLFNNKDEEEKKLSEEHSSLVNKAYSTLTHPLRRGIYMLQLKGIDIEKPPVNMTQEFLVDIMERNEEVDGLKDINEIQRLSKVYKNFMMDLTADVEKAFNEEDLGKVKEAVAKMKYFSNLEKKLRDLKQHFGIVD